MAENLEDRPKEDLTEEASPYRIEEFRRRGIVAQSKELSGLFALVAAAFATYIMTPRVGNQLSEWMKEVFRADHVAKLDFGVNGMLSEIFLKALKILFVAGIPICGAGFVLGILGSFVQVGSIFSTDPIQPDLNRINPIKGFKRLFGAKQLIDTLRLILKMTIVLAISYSLVKADFFRLPQYWTVDPVQIIELIGRSGSILFLALAGVLFLFALGDFGLQRWEHSKSLRLTKLEAKQEYKEREGDPQIKARIRSIQREMSRRRMMQAVKTADVVITNPTHIAVAILYDKEKMFAPRVVAKGADYIAEQIKKIAAEAGVPRVENVPLARTLYRTVKLNQFVPRALYQAVAEVLAYVYRLKNRTV